MGYCLFTLSISMMMTCYEFSRPACNPAMEGLLGSVRSWKVKGVICPKLFCAWKSNVHILF